MDTESNQRANLSLPQEPSSVPAFEVLAVSPQEESSGGLLKSASSPPQHTWLTVLKKEQEFLGVTQILIGMICLCFGTVVCSVLDISHIEGDIFSSFKAGYPFWGAIFFSISGILSILSERRNATSLARGSLGANTASSIAGATGITILIVNLKKSSAYIHIHSCQKYFSTEKCFVASFSAVCIFLCGKTKILGPNEMVVMMLFLTILGLGSALSLTIYGAGEELKGNKVPDDRVYEELNIYSAIYSELEDRGEMSPPTDL
ncbi:high affinity immunoglobulin epsilon receptor subunit beta isoform X1 [Piliocolobus tephrosceles]|uniref:high affinity immunoglobulin epsilon receptor subunit beta isoform X1 n=1 Tax=Piliocolobus tephrosceles TaxID=591936 RepID=UPI000C2A9F66|nr:high affinity immunoglobulin epsilon receptor subunit beta isoform X1 [Piliocolobus tephrosceles]